MSKNLEEINLETDLTVLTQELVGVLESMRPSGKLEDQPDPQLDQKLDFWEESRKKQGLKFGKHGEFKDVYVYKILMSAEPDELAKKFTANSFDKKGLFADKKAVLSLDAIIEQCPLELILKLEKVNEQITIIENKTAQSEKPKTKPTLFESVKNALTFMVNYISSSFSKHEEKMQTVLAAFEKVSFDRVSKESNTQETKYTEELTPIQKVLEKHKGSEKHKPNDESKIWQTKVQQKNKSTQQQF
jgi:hypothetical protein